jgi:hypothetical protein
VTEVQRQIAWFALIACVGVVIGLICSLDALERCIDDEAHFERVVIFLLPVLPAIGLRRRRSVAFWTSVAYVQADALIPWLAFLVTWNLAEGWVWADFGNTLFVMIWPATAAAIVPLVALIRRRPVNPSGRGE